MELYSNVIGEGKPFVILHGFLGMGDNWKTLGKKIADLGYEVHLVDQRNHGRSPHSDEFSYDLMANDLKNYCDFHELTSITLLGHSMGGKTAMLFSCIYPQYLDKLIVADIGTKYYAPHHQDILDGLSSLDFNTLKSRGDAEDALMAYIPDPGVRLFLLKNLYWKEKGVLGLRMNLDSLMQNVIEIGKELPSSYKFDGDVLFIKGGKSGYIKKEDEAVIKRQFPKAQIVEIPDAGHWLHADQPVLFLEEVLGFVKN